MGKEIKIIAHRGFWKSPNAAQNSLRAIDAAQNLGIDGFEVDVRMSLDGTLFLNHNPAIHQLEVARTKADLLREQRLDNGEPLVYFEDYLKHIRRSNKTLKFIEIKADEIPGYNREVTTKILEALEAYSMEKNIYLLSFSAEILKIVGGLRPDNRRMFLVEDFDFDLKELVNEGINGVGFDNNLIKQRPELISLAKGFGLTTNIWTVNTPEDFDRAKSLSPNYITTDYPHLLSQWE